MRSRYGDIEIEDVGTDLSLLSPSIVIFMCEWKWKMSVRTTLTRTSRARRLVLTGVTQCRAGPLRLRLQCVVQDDITTNTFSAV